MPSRLPAVVDFDGTLVDLQVDWATLVKRLGNPTLTQQFEPRFRDRLREAEMARLATAPVNRRLVAELSAGGPFAILTNNSSEVVAAFLERYPELKRRCVLIVGREQLTDSKVNPVAWWSGVSRCLERLGVAPGQRWRYVGDSAYELDHARKAGAAQITDIRWAHQAGDLSA